MAINPPTRVQNGADKTRDSCLSSPDWRPRIRTNLPWLVTNDTRTPKTLITRYAQRMLIENAICDAVRFFHIDALSSAVAMKVDFDMTLLVIASGLYRRLAQRMRGYTECQARQIFRDLIDMPADVTITEREVEVRFHRRAHLPIIAASGLLDEPVTVPWWNGMSLRMRV